MTLHPWIALTRPHQMVKNLLIFVPLITSHQISDLGLGLKVLYGFACLSLCASAVYIINDLADLRSDRSHPVKRERPLAKGAVSKRGAVLCAVLLLTLAIASAFLGSRGLGLAVTGYFILSMIYTFVFKKVMLLDVIWLALLYIARIVAGQIVAETHYSAWLLGLALFLFMSLGFLKRYTEIRGAAQRGATRLLGRGYLTEDLSQISSLGTASGFVSVLVLALYINSESVMLLYRTPPVLWFLCPLLIYWLSRLWMLAHRGQMNEDPILFAVKDRVSYAVGVISLGIIALATYGFA